MLALEEALADCRPFFGDYIDLSPSPAFRIDPFGFWIPNVLPISTPVFHAMWTDNRDVRPPPDGNWAELHTAQQRSPPRMGEKLGRSAAEPAQDARPSGPGLTTAGMRNQNVYTARGAVVST